jgi:hypothetical protein
LQLGVIERAVKLWSNPGDLVFSPFAGIGSEGVGALRCDRRFVGVELEAVVLRDGVPEPCCGGGSTVAVGGVCVSLAGTIRQSGPGPGGGVDTLLPQAGAGPLFPTVSTGFPGGLRVECGASTPRIEEEIDA